TVVVWLAGCSTFAATTGRRGSVEEPTPTPIPTAIVPVNPVYTVQRGEVIKEMQFTGRVSPTEEKDLFFRTNGRIRRILVKTDQMVKKGDLLADLENDNLERDLAAAKLNLERAESRLNESKQALEAQRARARLNLEIAQINLEQARSQDLTPRKTLAAIELEKAKLALDRAQAAYDAIAWRADKAASAEAANLYQATLNYNQAKANYDLAIQTIDSQKYQIAILERQVKQAQLALDELNKEADPLLANDVEVAKLNVQKLEAALADAQIVAPFDGRIMSVSGTEGRAATAFQPVMVIGDVSKLDIKANLSSSDVSNLAVGMPAKLVLSSRPGEEMAGSIVRLPPTTIPAGVNAADVDKSTVIGLDDPARAPKLELGDLVKVTVIVERKENALWLPPQAIRTFEGRRFVVVKEGVGQRRVDVKIGIESLDRVEIPDGVSEGQQVLGQ
ncbi:MAG: efflux RND transporter periplasmic adaptor subunit, partial [Anaerolineae bacterium]